jgi:endonuclease/exonuclease/phosphatase family metal-dependent hydrolase
MRRRLPPAARTIVPLAATLLAVFVPDPAIARVDTPDAVARLDSPARITEAKGVRGPQPGETTIRWKTSGRRTDYFKITTALSPFGPRHHSSGRHRTTFIVRNPDRRSYTLSAAQTAAAGAALNTGFRLFFRIKAINEGGSASRVRPYQHLEHATITGQSSRMSGRQLRFGEYNVRIESVDVRGHRWKSRQRLVARQIARVHPAVMGLQEMMPAMWTGRNSAGRGLRHALKRTGVGDYHLTRTTGYFSGAAQGQRILYDARQVAMTSTCRDTVPSCYISLPNPGSRRVAVYARFRDRASGKSFYFVSAHLTPGNSAAKDALRGRQAQAIDAGIRKVNTQHLPVVLAMDANSSQVSKGVDSPHTVLANAGWYNTLAARRAVNVGYNTVQHFELPQRPSAYGIGGMYDTIVTLGMPGADLWKQKLTGRPGASDHNLVFTKVRLPR